MVTMTGKKATPQRQKMSYQEYAQISNNSHLIEWVNGEAIAYVQPTRKHQSMVSFLTGLLDGYVRFFKSGTILPLPFEVQLWPNGPCRKPDIIFTSKENQSHLTEDKFLGGPDLLIEITSPSSATEDRVHKFAEYEKAGVREYWIIDSRPEQQQVDFFKLGSNNQYHPLPIDKNGHFHSTAIPNLWLDTKWLWQAETPNPQLALAEIMISLEHLSENARTTYKVMYKLLANR